MKKKLCLISLIFLVAATFTACAGTDVVLKYSPSSLTSIVEAYPTLVTDNTKTEHYYDLSVDGETTLRVSHDYELTGDADIVIKTPLQPFVDAGLDVTNLPAGYRVDGDFLEMTGSYGDGTGMQKNITDSLFESVTSDRSVLTYHQSLDHYGVKLTAGKFEWAKNYKDNDKDIVFVFRADPLKAVGIEVKTVAGWTFTTVQDNDGTDVNVLLKAYNLDQ